MSATQMHLEVKLTDREPFGVDVRMIDHHHFDTERGRRKWPAPGEAPFTWMTFLAFVGAKRQGNVPPDMRWEDFLAAAESVDNPDAGDDAADEAGPTQ